MNFIAVDLGNSRTKYGFYFGQAGSSPIRQAILDDSSQDFSNLGIWTNDRLAAANHSVEWILAPTGGTCREPLKQWIAETRPRDTVREIVWQDIPLTLEVEYPDRVGIDRILSAYAVSIWKNRPENKTTFDPQSPTMIVDAGSAMTIDLLSSDDVFSGGAIFPGFDAAAKALAEISPRLPRLRTDRLPFAVYPGRNTEEALTAGIYWGAVGTVRQFHDIVQHSLESSGLPGKTPIVLTGGNAEAIAGGLKLFMPPDSVFSCPYLVLSGIAAVVEQDSARDSSGR